MISYFWPLYTSAIGIDAFNLQLFLFFKSVGSIFSDTEVQFWNWFKYLGSKELYRGGGGGGVAVRDENCFRGLLCAFNSYHIREDENPISISTVM